MGVLKQSTAITVLVGPVLDSTGAAKTNEVVGSIKVTKNGTVGAANGSATLTHDHAGKYKLALTTGDTDTVGLLEVSLNSGTNDMPVQRFNVIDGDVYDALFASGATGLLPANITQVNGVAVDYVDRTSLGLLKETTIATLSSQTVFTLTAGSGDNDAYNKALVVVQDASNPSQVCFATVSDYVGSTKELTLATDPAIFIMAPGDNVYILMSSGVAASAILEAAFSSDTAKYQAKVWLVDDDAAGTPTDRYAVVWFKNGQPVVSGITSPDLWVYSHAAADLIGTTGSPASMTQIGSSGTYGYSATTTERISDGSLYIARVRATIDGATPRPRMA